MSELMIPGRDFDPRRFIRDPELRRVADIAAEREAKMAAGGWVQLLNFPAGSQPNATGALNTFTTAKDIVTVDALPANALNLGTVLRVTAFGVYSTTGTPTLALSVYYGGASAGTALCATAATTTASAVSGGLWWLQALGVVTALVPNSSTGLTIEMAGSVLGIAATASTPVLMPTAPAAVASLNPTTANTITVAAAWGTSSASNTITTVAYTLEALN